MEPAPASPDMDSRSTSPGDALYRRLMACAPDPDDLPTLAFAGVIAQRFGRGESPLLRGLTEADFQRLLDSYFSGTQLSNGLAGAVAPLDEYDDLVALLADDRVDDSETVAWLGHALATASCHDNHLWQDMGLPNRQALSRLLNTYFPTLAARNVGDMKWKKFFYRQLCERTGIMICKSPNCTDCTDYAICFGPES